ncbi:4-hydroxy-tetrahydrodipicolinate reductase [uncultured Alistipes sp.]|uniref:4-hydroxy-tetrahydrodipicolinate reductase n=1 Tax=uncultured Alistipes sp. TaxID=538949 RepID=UPI0026180BC3|nr:4-hydroxy-tetrahydrodipicolinate reductase [uncultured Alistipes sp.]
MDIALIGYGKMGREIEKILLDRGHGVPLIVDQNNASELNAENLRGIDAAIEFSTPETAFGNLSVCLEAGVPVVCGTTGWLERFDEAKALCREKGGAFFYASNYSVGVNVFFEVNRRLAELMGRLDEYDVTVEETHHTQKKDAPSGTAITLAEDIVRNVERKRRWTCGTTTVPDELEITAVRRGTVPGIHTVTYESEADTITVSHNAKSRRGFALGAVLAAEFIAGKRGVFSMKDLLGLG